MKTVTVKTAELEGFGLRYAVAKSAFELLGDYVVTGNNTGCYLSDFNPENDGYWFMKLISRYRIDFENLLSGNVRAKCMHKISLKVSSVGVSHGQAAMRAIVASELGDTVEIPEELMK